MLLPHRIFSTWPGPRSSRTGDLGLQREQDVKQPPGLGDLAGNVCIRVLAKHPRDLCRRQHADIFLVGRLRAIPGDIIGCQRRQPERLRR